MFLSLLSHHYLFKNEQRILYYVSQKSTLNESAIPAVSLTSHARGRSALKFREISNFKFFTFSAFTRLK